ncbi:MAG: type II secretion system F family protein, partial [Gammaproteobacteria bacterium]
MASKAEKHAIFIWEGTDRRGNKMRGETQSASISLAKAELRRKGINPSKVKKKATPLLGKKKKKITPSDIAIFSRQIATMMSSGVPLVQSFEIIGRGHENPAMQELILGIKADVEAGNTLADALGKHPYHFDELYCNLVNAGEQAGILETLLDKIATYKEKTENIKSKIKKAMFYPTAVIIVSFIVTAIL